MGRVLGHTAVGTDFSERTLRRYINDGLLRARRVGGQLELPAQEERYLRSHRDLLRALRAALRTERKVRLAVLFGSTATGEDTPASDVDLLVALEDGRPSYLLSLRARLADALGRDVQAIPLHDAHESPSLLADALEEGRVIVDRDGLWSRLVDERDAIFERAAQDERRIATILERLPLAREQLVVAMEEFQPDFDLDAFLRAAQHEDAVERNKVAVVERELDLIVNLLDELAARALDEARRLGAVGNASAPPLEQLAREQVIPRSVAKRLGEAKRARNELDHFYPPASWKVVHEAADVVLAVLHDYMTKVADWVQEIGADLSEQP